MARSVGTKPSSLHAKGVRYLPCEALPGMFRGEYLVSVSGVDPHRENEPIQVQMLVDSQEVKELAGQPSKNKPVRGLVQVMVPHSKKTGVVEVILPQPAQPVGERLFVNAGDLK